MSHGCELQTTRASRKTLWNVIRRQGKSRIEHCFRAFIGFVPENAVVAWKLSDQVGQNPLRTKKTGASLDKRCARLYLRKEKNKDCLDG